MRLDNFYTLLTGNLFLIFASIWFLTRNIDENWYFEKDETMIGIFLWIPIIILSVYLYRNAPPKK